MNIIQAATDTCYFNYKTLAGDLGSDADDEACTDDELEDCAVIETDSDDGKSDCIIRDVNELTVCAGGLTDTFV